MSARGPASTRPRRLRSAAPRATLGLCALVLAASGCAHTPEAPAPVDAVVQRLTAADFGLGNGLAHGPVVKIGDDARAVALAPRTLEVATLRGVRLEDGTARREIELPAAARDLPDDAFQIEVQELPFADALPQAVFDFFASETFHKLVDSSWRLARAAERPGAATLEVTPLTRQEQVQFNIDLRALLAQPKALESPAFTVPRAATIALGYGVAGAASAIARTPIRFRATLRCGDADEQALLDDTIGPTDTAGWRDASFPVPPADGCRLRLAATTPDGAAVRAAIWTEPLLSAPLAAVNRPPVDNVILISLDTLRADHLSGFGYPRATSPTIDGALIARGTTFRDVMTSFPRTDVAHLSLFTGLFPAAQPAPGRLQAGATATSLTESLRDAGLVTAAFTEDALIAGAFGFWFGFDRFVERSFAERERGAATFADGIAFARANKDRRFFLFLHTYKTHKPYVPSEQRAPFAAAADWGRLPFDDRIAERERAQVDAYDRTIRDADDLVATLLAELDRLGLAERTLVVLLSDHGEAFGEHGSLEHGFAGHQEQMHIPLVLRGPGIPAGLSIDTPASIVDVAPTVLELAGAKPLPYAQGISLVPALDGRTLPRGRPLFFSWLAEGARGVRHGSLKYLRVDHGHELFDLASDPGERMPRGRKRPQPPVEANLLADYEAASARLRTRFNANVGPAGVGTPIEGRMQDSLRALGYVD